MKTGLFLALGLTLALSSCSTITHTVQTAPVNTEVYSLTVADMEVSKQKQSATAEWKWNPFNMISLKGVKDDATAKLLAGSDADVLVDPQFTVERRGLFRGGSVTVTGFPATYKNFRNMTEEDAKKIAAVDGNLDIAIVSPFINTSASLADRRKKAKKQEVSFAPAKTKAKGRKGKSSLALNIGYNFRVDDDVNGTDLGLKYRYSISNPLRLEAFINYEFGEKNEERNYSTKSNFFNYGVNLQYLFGKSETFCFYPFVGIGGSDITRKAETSYGSHSDSDSAFLFNIGLGADYYLTSKFAIGADLKYQHIGDEGGVGLNLNLIYTF